MKKLKMRPNETNGILITFCGLDGCGKTTMIKKLMWDLDRDNVFLTKQPTDFVRNSDIFRTYMDNPDHDAYDYRSLSLLAASDRVQHVNKVIQPELEKGKVVISDRYIYSCLANLRARGYESDKWLYEISESIIKPDVAFFFDLPVETAVSRVRSRENEKDRYIDMELQYRLREEYIKICKANGGILVPSDIARKDTYAFVKDAVEKVIKNGNAGKSI
jgi:dTMP kinase